MNFTSHGFTIGVQLVFSAKFNNSRKFVEILCFRYQFLCHILRNLMPVVSIHDDFYKCLLFFGDFNFFLDRKQKQYMITISQPELTNPRIKDFGSLGSPLTVWWWRWPACCLRCLSPLGRLLSTVPGRPWCSFAASSTCTGSLSAGLPAVTKASPCVLNTPQVFIQQHSLMFIYFYPEAKAKLHLILL